MSKGWSKGSSSQWRRVRSFVLARDGWACRRCGVGVHPRCCALGCPACGEVHHVDGVVSGHNVERCVTLCVSCHRRQAVSAESPASFGVVNGVHRLLR